MLYVIGILFLIAGMFAYGNQDQVRLFDSGEAKMASAVLARHGKMMSSCVLPGSAAWCDRSNSPMPLDPPANARFTSRYAVNETAPGAQAIDSIASVVQGVPGDFRVFTFAFVSGGVGGERSSTLSAPLVSAQLAKMVARYGEVSLEQRPAMYDKVAGIVRFTDRKNPRSVAFDPAVAGIVIPDGAPAMVSPNLTPSLP